VVNPTQEVLYTALSEIFEMSIDTTWESVLLAFLMCMGCYWKL